MNWNDVIVLLQANADDDYRDFSIKLSPGVTAMYGVRLPILKQIAKKVKIDFEKMPITLDRYGNTSGASAILSLCDRYGESCKSQTIRVLCCGFGIGISLGITSFEIAIDDILPIVEDDEIFEEGLITNPNQLYDR